MKPSFTSPNRPLDIVVALVSTVAVVRAVLYVDHWHALAAQPDTDGLELLGVLVGIAYLVLLVPALLCTLAGVVTGSRSGITAGRILLLAAAVGAPIPLCLAFVLVM